MIGMVDLFLFEQKTAYELRISDLSSDVCSSDLELQTDYVVIYNDQYVKKDMLVSLDVKNRPLEVVLNKMLSPRGLIYEVRDKTIAISGRAFKDDTRRASCRERECQ